MNGPTPQDVLNTPLPPDNDAGAADVRGYLVKLLLTLWAERESFSGKRPLGNSGWDWDLFAALGRAGHIRVVFDEDGYVDDIDHDQEALGTELVASAIRALGGAS